MSAIASKFDAASFAAALVLHGAALLYVYLTPQQPPRRITTVEVEIRKPKPPPPVVTPPEPLPPEPPPEVTPKRLVRNRVQPQQVPKPTQPPRQTPEPPKPVFGIDPSQTGGEGISVPVGNTTMADPQQRPKVKEVPPLPPATSVPAGNEYHPVAEEELKQLPEIDNDDCGLSMKQKWEASDANANGLEGEVVLRIELDERGKGRSIKVVKSFSAEAEKIAIGFLRFDPRCRFRPALGKDGKPAAFVIERYTVRFQRER